MTPYFFRMLEVYVRHERAKPPGSMLIPHKELVDECIDHMELEMMGISGVKA